MCICVRVMSGSVSGSVDMMGHPDLQPECDVKQLEPLLPEHVVDDLLGKYLQTFTVSPSRMQHWIKKKTFISYILCSLLECCA